MTEAKLRRLIKRGIISKSQKDFMINHKVWTTVSNKIKGFDYEAFEISK